MENNLLIKVISLQDALNKRSVFSKNNAGLPNFSFFDAVNGKRMYAESYFNYIKKIKGRAKRRGYITPSELGCTLSHLEVYKEFLNSDKEWLLLLEDDVFSESSNLGVISNLIKNSDNSEYIHILGGQEGLKRPKLIEFFFRKQINYLKSPLYGFFLYRTCSYLISREVAKKLCLLHSENCYITDDWGNIAIKSRIKGFTYSKIFSHPLDLSDSSIELERRSNG